MSLITCSFVRFAAKAAGFIAHGELTFVTRRIFLFCTDVIVQSLQAWQSECDEWVLLSNEANAACLRDVIRWWMSRKTTNKKKRWMWMRRMWLKHLFRFN